MVMNTTPALEQATFSYSRLHTRKNIQIGFSLHIIFKLPPFEEDINFNTE